eukprot:356781-Chlamydomonas_euryale.AAC.7
MDHEVFLRRARLANTQLTLTLTHAWPAWGWLPWKQTCLLACIQTNEHVASAWAMKQTATGFDCKCERKDARTPVRTAHTQAHEGAARNPAHTRASESAPPQSDLGDALRAWPEQMCHRRATVFEMLSRMQIWGRRWRWRVCWR